MADKFPPAKGPKVPPMQSRITINMDSKSKAAVATLEGHGFTWCGGEQWKPPLGLPPVFISNDREDLERYRKAAASVVPKATDHDARMAVGFNRYAQSGYIEGWNACRAAMLQSFGNSEQVQVVTRIECDLSQVDTEKLTAAIREMNSKPSEPQRIITEPVSQPYKLPCDWQKEAERLAEIHGTSFVLFRHGEVPQCADPTKVILTFTDKGLGYDSTVAPQKGDE